MYNFTHNESRTKTENEEEVEEENVITRQSHVAIMRGEIHCELSSTHFSVRAYFFLCVLNRVNAK